jgi:hypothetical protein
MTGTAQQASSSAGAIVRHSLTGEEVSIDNAGNGKERNDQKSEGTMPEKDTKHV